MLDCVPEGTFSLNYQITENEMPVAEVVFGRYDEAKIRHLSVVYEVGREGVLGSQWILKQDGDELATAKAPSIFFHSFDLSAGKNIWSLNPVSGFSGDFKINSDAGALGTISRKSSTSRPSIECHPSMPVCMQLFAFCVVVFVWRPETTATGSALPSI